MTACRALHRRSRGFTLAELLLAASLGALLVTAAASSAGSFSQTVARLRTDSGDDYEKVTASISRDVRYGWWADVPAPDHLRIADSAGLITEYYKLGNSLLVQRPSGDTGSVITGLSDVLFEQTTQRRLREARQNVISGRLCGVAAPASTVSALTLQQGNALALGFTLSSDAGPLSVAGVEDRFLFSLPDHVDLYVAETNPLGTLHADIYAARAPGDGSPRPSAASLGSFDVALAALPVGVISVAGSLVHGLLRGTTYAAPAVSVPISLTGAQALQPGVAYTLLISVRGSGSAIIASWVNVVGANDAVVYRAQPSDPWASQSSVMPFSVSGTSTATGTAAQDVASQIRVTLTPSGQPAHIASAAVFSQVLAEDPWLGVVPGEAPPVP